MTFLHQLIANDPSVNEHFKRIFGAVENKPSQDQKLARDGQMTAGSMAFPQSVPVALVGGQEPQNLR